MSSVGLPVSGWMDTVAELAAWQPGADVYNRANLTPLRSRSAPAPGPKLFLYHDMFGGYIPDGDLYPQGTPNPNYYAFDFWQYVDSFSYFTHHWLAIPPPGWINAAHRNGVPILGNLTPPYNDSGQFVQPMLLNPRLYVDQLVAMAQYYGFDGWAFNFETNLVNGPAGAKLLVAFLQQLTSNLHSAIPGSMTMWYDAVCMNGVIAYQNELNANNKPYFDACDGIFLNYAWNQDGLESSASLAGARARDVYAGIQPFNYQFGTYQPIQTASLAGISAGLFAQSWTYQKQTDADPFRKRENRMWIGHPVTYPNPVDCIATVVPLHPVPATCPFVTNFNTGHGRLFFIGGVQVSQVRTELAVAHWGNMSAQDVLPSYRYLSGSSSPFQAHMCHDSAYDGGASLLLHANQGGPAGGSTTFTLFEVALSIPATCTLVLALSTPSAAPEVTVLLAGPSGPPASFTVSASSIPAAPTWQEFTQDLSAQAGLEVTSIQIQCTIGDATTSEVAVLIGELRLLDVGVSGKLPNAVAGLVAQNLSTVTNCLGSSVASLDLVWNPPTDDTCAYNIYQLSANGGYLFLGRAFTNAWNIQNMDFGTCASVTLAVQPRNAYGYVQPLGSATASLLVILQPVPGIIAGE